MATVGAAAKAARGTLASGVDSAYARHSPFVGARLRCVVLGVDFSPLQLRRESSVPGRGRRSEIMGKKLFVGNVSFETTSADLEAALSG